MNEFQAAYETSKLTFTGHIIPKIPDGMFAVVLESQAHCGYTDAVLPMPHRSVQRLCGSRRVAEYYARKIVEANTDEDGGCEVWAEVYPKAPRVSSPLPISDDDIPF